MRSAARALLWAWILLDSGARSASLPDISDKTFIEECVRAHNEARSSVNPPASDMLHMTWDEGLAITARAWARKCVFEHNTYLDDARRMHPTFSSVGENLWTGYPPSYFNVLMAIKSWVDEDQEYNYGSNRCTGVCGHYTQVVWASSYKVGCAAQLCPKGVKSTNFGSREGVIFVCDYATAGNVNGRRPYANAGAGCSGCEGRCEENLCRSQDRDSQKSYNWSPDWDQALPFRDQATPPPFRDQATPPPSRDQAPPPPSRDQAPPSQDLDQAPPSRDQAPPPPSRDQATPSQDLGLDQAPPSQGFSYVTMLVVRPIALLFAFMAAYAVRHVYPDVFCYE